MNVTKEEFKVNLDTKEITVLYRINGMLENFEESDMFTGRRGLEDYIAKDLAPLVIEKFMLEKSDEVIKKINIETLVKKLQIDLLKNLK